MIALRRGRQVRAESGERDIEGVVELVVGTQEGLDSPPQFGIARALGVQHGGAVRRVAVFRGRQEHGLIPHLSAGISMHTQLARFKKKGLLT